MSELHVLVSGVRCFYGLCMSNIYKRMFILLEGEYFFVCCTRSQATSS